MSSIQNHQTEEFYSISSLRSYVCWVKEDVLIENLASQKASSLGFAQG
jgi:hypothetical protein